MNRLRADLLLLLSAFFWGTAFLGQKEANGGLSPLTIVGARFLLGALALLPMALRETRRSPGALTRREWQQAGLIGLCVLGGASFEQWGLVTTSVTNAGFLTALYVVLVPFMLWGLTREKPRWVVLLACGICIAGAWLLMEHGQMRRWTVGDGLVVLADFFWALSITLIGVFLAKSDRPFFLSCTVYGVTALLGLVVGPLMGGFALPDLTAALPAILYAGLCGGIAGGLQIVAQRHTPAAEAGLIMALQSVFAALAGAALLSERLTVAAAVGCGLILFAVVMVEVGPALLHKLKHST